MSPFSPPSEEWQRRAFRGRSPDSWPKYSPTLRAFPSCGTVAYSSRISLPFTVARAVAALHRSSRTPLAHHGCQRQSCKERGALLRSFSCQTVRISTSRIGLRNGKWGNG